MVINTKREIYDQVWVMHKGHPVQAMIMKILIYLRVEDGDVRHSEIYYLVIRGSKVGVQEKPEYLCFNSKAELLQSI